MAIRNTRQSRVSQTPQKDSWLGRLMQRKLLLATCGVTLVAVVIGVGIVLSRNANDDGNSSKQTGQKQDEEKSKQSQAKKAPVKIDLVSCRVYTPQPGFTLIVDGTPAIDKNGERLKTPCMVSVPRGTHQFTAAKSGFRDIHLDVNIDKDDVPVDFTASVEVTPDDHSILDAAYINHEPGESISLFTLSESDSRELDPYISPDGTLLYFVSDRDGVNAIYYAVRNSAFSYFDQKPIRVENSRGSDLPASPTLSADSLSIVYTIPKYRMILALSRDNPLDKFLRKKTLKSGGESRGSWFSAQTVRDGNNAWWLYWTQRNSGEFNTIESSSDKKRTQTIDESSESWEPARRTVLAPLSEQKFVRQNSVNLDGAHPCLSSDGLRQYLFDGKFLKRATRDGFAQPFSEYKLIADLGDREYEPSPNRRSFTITDDEQWLFYESKGDVYMVRVFKGKGRGFVAEGKTISPRPPKVVKLPMPRKKEPTTTPPTIAKKKIDPRKVPLPYPVYKKELVALLKTRDYAAAKKRIVAAFADPKLGEDKKLIQWDREGIDRIEAFWKDLGTALSAYKPEDSFSIGNGKFKFVSFKNDMLSYKSQVKTVTKNIREMRSGDLAGFVTGHFGRKDPLRQIRIGSFLYFDGEGNPLAASIKFRVSGKEGETILEQLAARQFQQARHEFDRDNLSVGLQIARRILIDYPKSKAATDAKSLNEEAYKKTKWDRQGRRTWKIAGSTYTASLGKSNGSVLRSPMQYENFELRLEWKSAVPSGQGGVYFRYTGNGDLTESAFKIQLSDDFGISADNYCTGALFKIAPPTVNAVGKRGTWNTLRLRVIGESVQAFINGRKVLDTKATSETIPTKGYVALDGVIGGITYRRTLLLELPKAE